MALPDPSEDINLYYEVTDELLGKGYFAVVKVGRDLKTGEEVAIKLVDKNAVEKEETLQNEIDILASVSHPHVVSMRAVFDTPDTLYIVMDLMNGGELYEEIVQRKLFSEEDAAHIMRQMCDALKYLHSKGIVHRDLKLENLLLVGNEDLTIRIADFGLSKLYSGKALQTACGTPFYVAPDILLGTGYGPEVDMWAAGVLLYVLLSGRLPFAAQNDTELFKRIIEGNLVFKKPQFDSVSENAKDLISKLIVVDPAKRFTAAQALEHPFLKSKNSEAPLPDSFYDELQRTNTLSRAKLIDNSK